LGVLLRWAAALIRLMHTAIYATASSGSMRLLMNSSCTCMTAAPGFPATSLYRCIKSIRLSSVENAQIRRNDARRVPEMVSPKTLATMVSRRVIFSSFFGQGSSFLRAHDCEKSFSMMIQFQTRVTYCGWFIQNAWIVSFAQCMQGTQPPTACVCGNRNHMGVPTVRLERDSPWLAIAPMNQPIPISVPGVRPCARAGAVRPGRG
jgi:hypothetical protein